QSLGPDQIEQRHGCFPVPARRVEIAATALDQRQCAVAQRHGARRSARFVSRLGVVYQRNPGVRLAEAAETVADAGQGLGMAAPVSQLLEQFCRVTKLAECPPGGGTA